MVEPGSIGAKIQSTVGKDDLLTNIKEKVYNFLLWYTSYFYWAVGAYLGITFGIFHFARTYFSTVFSDAMHVIGKRAPPFVERAAHEPAPAPTAPLTAAAETIKAALPKQNPLPHITPGRKQVPEPLIPGTT